MSIILSFIFMTLRNFAPFIDVYIPAQKLIGVAGTEFATTPFDIPHITRGYQALHLLIRTWGKHLIEPVYYAPFIMIGPYLTIYEVFDFLSAQKLITAMRGNIDNRLRYKFLIMLPWYLMADIQGYLGYIFERLGLWHFWQFEYYIYINTHSLTFFICDFVGVIFSVND